MRYHANKKVWRWRQPQRWRQQDPHQKQYVPLSFGGGHNEAKVEAWIICCVTDAVDDDWYRKFSIVIKN